MSISRSGLCSQWKCGPWEEKGQSLVYVEGGLYSEGKYKVISLGGILNGLCSQGVLIRRRPLGQV